MEEKESTALSEVSKDADADSVVHDSGDESDESEVQSSTSSQEYQEEYEENSEEKSEDFSEDSSEDSSEPLEDEEEITEETSDSDSETLETNETEENKESDLKDDSEISEESADNNENASVESGVVMATLEDGQIVLYSVDAADDASNLFPVYDSLEAFEASPMYVTRYENEVLNRLEFIQYALALQVALIFLLIFRKK